MRSPLLDDVNVNVRGAGGHALAGGRPFRGTSARQRTGIPSAAAASILGTTRTDKDVIFFYGQYAHYGGGNTELRDIPRDGRTRDDKKSIEATY